ncbi:MoaD/ThiS family protein [Saccharopolyspora hordei]|uniref:Molybdopterin converting factor small subunit n=1 Tax=Saccharopolyspora hordei TaxID=1838 RepID=A0A853AB23_9PSEU|nr:MoaD/ThiS family protein [Saccharopolyspora hordei]NYI81584.1 molybdopterin converting factor small subunit [Saccharopolyspora hordei]
MTTSAEQVATVSVRYFAGARAAAGVAEEAVRLASPATVDDVLAAVRELHDERLAKVLPACSFLLDGVAVRDRGTEVPAEATLDVLPPFAGG